MEESGGNGGEEGGRGGRRRVRRDLPGRRSIWRVEDEVGRRVDAGAAARGSCSGGGRGGGGGGVRRGSGRRRRVGRGSTRVDLARERDEGHLAREMEEFARGEAY